MTDEGAVEVLVDEQVLKVFARQLFLSAGVAPEDAEDAARILVTADRRGVTSHGVARLPVYLRRIDEGGTSATARPRIEREIGATAVVDGAHALGLVVARFGMNKALDLAGHYGVGVVTCRQSGHFGPAAEYALMGPPAGCVALVATSVNPTMAPWGSIDPLLGNNPISVAAPATDAPFVLDLALSATARGKIRLAAARGESLPPDWATDVHGRPTVDPNEALRGLLRPIGGPKGSALSMAVEILTSILSGAALSRDIAPQAAVADEQDVGHFFLALDVAHFVPLGSFVKRMDELVAGVRASRPTADVTSVLAPGDLERQRESQAVMEGIRLDWSTWASLAELAAQRGLSTPKVDRVARQTETAK